MITLLIVLFIHVIVVFGCSIEGYEVGNGC